MIFQSDIQHIDTELSQLQALLDAKRQQRSLFEELDAETNAAIEKVALLKTKIEAVSVGAIASLKSAVLTLFDNGDNGNGGGNHPIEPTPGPDDDEPELLCLNGLTGECLTTADDEELPADNPVGDEWVLPSSTALTGQTCDINPALYWENNAPDGSGWEFASPLACLIWEDAPLTGQHCTISPSTTEDNENKSTNEVEGMAYIELVRHPENNAIAYQRKHDGQIVCTYLGFRTKVIASSWLRAVEVLTSAVELRQAKRLEGFKWELKAKGLSINQINRLAGEDLTKTYRAEIGSAKPPEGASKHISMSARIKPGVKVVATLTPSDTFEATSTVGPDNRFFAKSLLDDRRQLFDVEAVTIVEAAKSPTQYAKVLLKDSEHYGQTLPVSAKSANEIGYTLKLPNGDNHWFRADMVQIMDADIEEVADPTEPPQSETVGGDAEDNAPSTEPPQSQTKGFEFGDIAEVIADLNGTHLIGSFGKVKFAKDNRIALEIDEQLAYFQPEELKLRSKAEPTSGERQQLQTGQVLLNNRVVTTGNYFGAARRTAIANARRGTANKIAALELVKAGLSPELAMAAATGTDDASDF